ncbi:ABC transporter substrate-binding protein [Streptomyces sp. NPDC055078]
MRAFRTLAATVVAVALLGTACSPGGSDDPDSIRIGVLPGSTQQLPELIATSQGLFKKAGLTVKTVNMKSGPEGVTLLMAGEVDLVATPPGAVLPMSERVTIVAGQQRNLGMELVRRKGFKDSETKKPFPEVMKELAGAKIGIPAMGGYGQVLLEEMYAQSGESPGKANFVAVGTGQTQISALSTGQVDLTFSNPIAAATLKERDKGETLVLSRDVPKINNFPEMVYATKRGASGNTKKAIATYLGAVEEAMDWSKNPANTKALAAEMTEGFGIKDPSVATAVAEAFSPSGGNQVGQYGLDVDRAGFDSLVAFMVENKLLKKSVGYDKAVGLIKPTP